MKIRNGFVSNSSTSSFICTICDTIYMLMDGDPSSEPYHLCTCENGHGFCREHILYPDGGEIQAIRKYVLENVNQGNAEILEKEKALEDIEFKKFIKEYEDSTHGISLFDEFYYKKIPTNLCPFCSFEEIDMNEITNYLNINMMSELKEKIL